MAKTKETLSIEAELYKSTVKLGTFGCPEVTIGFWGDERVDFLSMDTKGIFRAYEIKVTKADFHSPCKNSFVGHFNYYALPNELYQQVKAEIPSHIGVWVGGSIVKKPKRVEPRIDTDTLMKSLIRSLARDAERYVNSVFDSVDLREKLMADERKKSRNTIERLRREVRRLRKDLSMYSGRRSFDMQDRGETIQYYRTLARKSEARIRMLEAWIFRRDTD